MHYRSASVADVDLYLQQRWEECILKNVILPVHNISHYMPPDISVYEEIVYLNLRQQVQYRID